MIPRELQKKEISLPETDDYSIVVITGSEIRHKRFAYRMQQEFGDLVVAWFQVENVDAPGENQSTVSRLWQFYNKAKQQLLSDYNYNDLRSFIFHEGIFYSIGKAVLLLKWAFSLLDTIRRRRNYQKQQVRAERKFFAKEIEELRKHAKLEPTIIDNPNSEDFIRHIRELSPYFFLSLGGALYGKKLLESIRGVAINQHAGWSPDYKGSGTTLWALYNRDLDRVGSTVHITTTGMDAGGIFRRSNPCLVESDTLADCFLRVVALGTELMVEVVDDIIAGKSVSVFEQSKGTGKTFLGSQMTGTVLKQLQDDFAHNWLKTELVRFRQF